MIGDSGRYGTRIPLHVRVRTAALSMKVRFLGRRKNRLLQFASNGQVLYLHIFVMNVFTFITTGRNSAPRGAKGYERKYVHKKKRFHWLISSKKKLREKFLESKKIPLPVCQKSVACAFLKVACAFLKRFKLFQLPKCMARACFKIIFRKVSGKYCIIHCFLRGKYLIHVDFVPGRYGRKYVHKGPFCRLSTVSTVMNVFTFIRKSMEIYQNKALN